MISRNDTNGKSGQLADLMEQLNEFVHGAARDGKPIHEVERAVWQQLLKIGHVALDGFITEQADGDLGETFEMSDGRVLKRLEYLHHRTYRSIFGTFELERAVYGSREGQKIEFVPLDQRLQLPESGFSYVLQDWNQALGVEHAFLRVDETMERILGFHQPVDSLERMNRQMATDVEGFRSSRRAPPGKQEGEIIVMTGDNKGIPMRRPADQRPVGSHRNKGEKANKKQLATVGAVYTVDPHIRTAHEVVAGLFRDDSTRKKKDTPVAQHKRTWSSLKQEKDGQLELGEDLVFRWMAQEVLRRNPKDQKVIVCLMDGGRSLWKARERHLPREDVIELLDVIHVTPRLWDAAHLFHREGSEEASKFVRQRLLRILQGEIGYVIGGLRQMSTKHQLRAHKATQLRQICRYLEANRHRMNYDEYLAAGYPIASGVIEGACRHVVKDRMERSGMRWTAAGAQAMLDLRTTYINGQWNVFQKYRMTQANRRLYPDCHALEAVEWPLAA